MNTETREIVITIKGDGSASASPKGNKEKESGVDLKGLYDAYDEMQKGKNENVILASVLANQAYSFAKREIIAQANYEISKYFSLTDNYRVAQDLNNAKSLLGIGMGILSSGVAGAAIGGPVGAVLGVATAIGADLFAANRRLDAQQLGIDKANAQLSYTMSRRGASLTDDSIGENR